MTQYEKLNTYILAQGICSSATLLTFWKQLTSSEQKDLIYKKSFKIEFFKEIIRKYEFVIKNTKLLRCLKEYTLWQNDANILARKIQQVHIKVISFFSKKYPLSLKYITDAPLLLYCKGNTTLLTRYQKMVAMVGTRSVNSQSRKIAKRLVWEASLMGLLTVSGFAEGIDRLVWEYSEKFTVPTLMVLPYFKEENFYLSNRQEQLFVSEIPPFYNFGIEKRLFVQRNRIIAGLSMVTLVLQAPVKSGALYTSQLATSYGRDAFFYLASLTDSHSLGQVLESVNSYNSQFFISMQEIGFAFGAEYSRKLVTNIDAHIKRLLKINSSDHVLSQALFYRNLRTYLWNLGKREIEEFSRIVIELKRLGVIYERKGIFVFNFLYSPDEALNDS